MGVNRKIACCSAPRQADAKSALASRQNSRLDFRVLLGVLALASFGGLASAQVPPNDAASECSFESTEFPGWFEGRTVTANGAVSPANSLEFSSDNHCTFHKWSAQMFLWLTSPVGDVRVFQSPDFYTVSAPVNGERTLTQNAPGKIENFFSLRNSKPAEHSGQPFSRGVLMAQNKSLVYSTTFVNDVYAFFRTGAKNGVFDIPQFPTQSSELERIRAFAENRGIRFRHRNVLAVEVKASWVETAGLREAGLDPSKYITINAMIPTYDRSDPTNRKWTLTNAPRKAELALVGMHVVGSAKGHADMIWATFEHIDNTPVASYSYNSTSGLKEVPESTGGTWLFSRRSPDRFNEPLMHARNALNIEAVPEKTIEPSDTRREHAWGSSPNDLVHNSRIIAINNSTMRMLASGDVRRNYLLIGAAWNLGVGAKSLANTTMETYEQRGNCFDCHYGDFASGRLSRVYDQLTPLPPP